MFLILILILGYIGGTIYYANIQARENIAFGSREAGLMRVLLQAGGGMAGLLAFFVLLAANVSRVEVDSDQPTPEISFVAVIFGVGLAAAACAFILMVVGSPDFRNWLGAQINRVGGQFNPDSPVHITAIVMTTLTVALIIIEFVVAGGQEAVEEATTEISLEGIVLQNALFIAIAALGVGYAIRRDDNTAFKRLGLRWPTADDWRWGVGMGVAAYVALIIVGVVFAIILGDLNNEAANNQAESLAAIPIIPLFLSISLIAIAEEIFFRGALQPVFGNAITTAVFAIMHTQSILSPLIVVLIGLSYMLGWLRERQSTTAAIIAHFCYNMIQLLLQIAIAT